MKSMKRIALMGVGSTCMLAASTAFAGGSTMYVVHGGGRVQAPHGGEIGTVDSNGAYTSLGRPTGAGLTGLAGAGSRLFASTSDHTLITMDLAGTLAGESAFFGAGFDAGAGDRVTDLASDSNGTVYASARVGGADGLYTVDTSTAELTFVGVFGFSPFGFVSIAFDGADNLYAQHTNANDLHLINANNGNSNGIIGPGVPDGALGLGWSPDDGQLYGSHCCGVSLGEELFSVSTTNGSSNLFVDYADDRRIHDIHFVIPAPGALALLGVAGLSARRRRRSA